MKKKLAKEISCAKKATLHYSMFSTIIEEKLFDIDFEHEDFIEPLKELETLKNSLNDGNHDKDPKFVE